MASRAGPRLESGHLVALRASRRGGRGPRRRRLRRRPLRHAPRRRRLVRRLAIAIAAAFVLAQAAAHAQDADGRVEVQISRAHVSTELGGKFTFTSTVVNRGTTPAEGLIAHLNVLSLRPGVYVDPEDWASQRTRYLRPIPPGGTLTTTWHVQAVNVGSFGVYVAVLSE